MFDWLFSRQPRWPKFELMTSFETKTVSRRAMTADEEKAFDAAFAKFDEAFAELDKAFKTTGAD